MTHREEIEFGRRIDPQEMVAYRCAHNHTWYVVGPHIWCRCPRRIAHELSHVACLRGGGYANHTCDPTCAAGGHRGWQHSTYVEVIECGCGARTKGPARIDRPTLRIAASVHALGGFAAVTALRRLGSLVTPRCRTVSVDPAAVFAAGHPFPSNQCRW